MKKIIFSIIFILPLSLILISYDGISAETKLRNKPGTKLNEKDIETCIKKYNFFDKKLNEKGDFTNDFVDNGDGTITDKATGLMWGKKGSSKKKSFYYAKKYVKKLNKKKFAGNKNWRIPTIEELYSLLEPDMNQERYIHPVFATKAHHYWSIDESDLVSWSPLMRKRRVTIDFTKGTVSDAYEGDQPGGASVTNFRSFAKAVRTIE
ncbi:MAG TPA: DUF1566 domain-containing protein [Desulfobacterales bacterium]|nr:DUF1566 domain-containing protein [Desulfobacterales bacterium]